MLEENPIFTGLTADELERALELMRARRRVYERGELVQRLGEPFTHVGIVLEGAIEGSFDNERFDQVNMNRFGPGDSWGAAYACAGTAESPIQLEALTLTQAVLLDVRPLMGGTGTSATSSPDGAALRAHLLRNMLALVSHQATFLARKVMILGQGTLRDRVVMFLRGLPADADGWRRLPFTQTAMAQFIGANRSALSRELGRMADDGVIQLDGRRVRLLE